MKMNTQHHDDVIDIPAILKRAGIDIGMTVADFGVGRTALFTLPAAQIVGKHGVVYACDVIKSVVEVVEEKCSAAGVHNVRTVWTDIELYGAAKQIITESVDVGILANTLYQSEKRAAILRECLRMIRLGGKLLVVEWKPGPTTIGPTSEMRVTIDEMKRLAQHYELKLTDEFEAGEYHWAVVFQKV